MSTVLCVISAVLIILILEGLLFAPEKMPWNRRKKKCTARNTWMNKSRK